MGNGDEGFNAVLSAAVKYPVIEFQALLVGFLFHPRGEYPGPVDGGAEHLKAHLRKEGDILLIMMIKINGLMGGIQRPRLDGCGQPFGSVRSSRGAVIRHGLSLAVQVPGALQLVCRNRAAPEEIIS